MQTNISIVTAFFDIGRGNWTPDKGHPHYLQRSPDTYLERFGYLAQMENQMVVYTTEDMAPRVWALRSGKEDITHVIVTDPRETHVGMRDQIVRVQTSEEFKDRLNPTQAKNPEYWNPDYVLTTDLKAYYANLAVQDHLVTNEMVSWIDFGYCRSMANIPPSKKWVYNFNPEKIHLFDYKDYDNKPVERFVLDNDVYILGAKAVAHQNMWPHMDRLMKKSFDWLNENNLVDDDQGLWLLSYLMEKEKFEMHRIPDHQLGHDPFVLFNAFNDTPGESPKNTFIYKTT